jgi:thiol-disulfide isomerase/thioredoxin
MLSVLASILVLLVPTANADQTRVEHVRVELMTPGGPLPFVVELRSSIKQNEDGSVDPFHAATVINGDERLRVGSVEVEWETNEHRSTLFTQQSTQQHVTLGFPHFDSTLEWTMYRGPTQDTRGSGFWRKQRTTSVAQLPLFVEIIEGTHGALADRFDPLNRDEHDGSGRFEGRWRVDFESSDEPAIGEFDVYPNGRAFGTFLTTTGDYRYLEGRVDGDLMRLSTFDGAHAFLFHATLQPDDTIAGDFWSGDWWHEPWTATRDDDAQLPDMFAQTSAVSENALDELVFTNLEGEPTRVVDALNATNAPARIIEVFGTWCPNCADAGRELAALKDEYGDNLGILGLAFELTDDHDRSSTQVKRYLERFGADWDVLIAGLNNKDAATKELAILDKVRAYPTTIFLNSDNEIVEIHTGFTGPATGDAYTEQHARYVSIIESLINDE